MISKKLAIASATALMLAGMGAAQAQSVSTPTESTTAQQTGLMTELSTSLATIFNAGQATTITPRVDAVTGVDAVYSPWSTLTASQALTYTPLVQVDGAYVPATAAQIADPLITKYAMTTAPVTGIAAQVGTTTIGAANPVDITALAGAVNLSTINGSIDISGANVSIKGVLGEVSATANAVAATSDASAFAINGSKFATTVIGAMNSSTLDVMNKTVDINKTFTASLDVATLAGDAAGGTTTMTLPGTGADTLLASVTGSNVLSAGGAVSLAGLNSDVSQTASSLTEELQTMNVFNMALNMAPIVAGVKIAATVDTNSWFLNPQTGVVDLSNIQISTTAIGAMNSSLTHLGANLTTLAK